MISFLSINTASATAAKSLQSCLTLCDPIDSSPPGSPIPGILQARTLEWVAISFSNAWKWKVKSEREVAQSCPTLSDPMDCSLPGSSVHGISRQEYWSGVPLPSPVYPLTAPNIVNEIFIIAQWLYEKWLQLIFLQVLNFKYEFDFKRWNCDLKLCMLADHLNYIFWN